MIFRLVKSLGREASLRPPPSNNQKGVTMLYTIDGKKVEAIPHKPDHDWLASVLSATEYLAIIAAIHGKINDMEIFNASFLPGSDWEGTPF